MATVTAPRPAAVAIVLSRASRWTPARRKSDGKPFFFVPGSQPGAVYMTAADGCTCPAAQHSVGGDCKHQVAVRQHQARQQQPAPASTYERLFPGCRDCGDLADGLDGRCSTCASDREHQLRQEGARIADAQIADGLSFADVLNPLAE